MRLTKRERQVADLILCGCNNKEIAENLGITVRTVKMHKTNIYSIYHITSGVKRVKLVAMLYKEKREKKR